MSKCTDVAAMKESSADWAQQAFILMSASLDEGGSHHACSNSLQLQFVGSLMCSFGSKKKKCSQTLYAAPWDTVRTYDSFVPPGLLPAGFSHGFPTNTRMGPKERKSLPRAKIGVTPAKSWMRVRASFSLALFRV